MKYTQQDAYAGHRYYQEGLSPLKLGVIDTDNELKKPKKLEGRWPTGTWFQRRLQKVRIDNASS